MGLRKQIKRFIKNIRIRRQISSLSHFSDYSRGSSKWLAACELEMGGLVTNVSRNKVSSLDPRASEKIKSGGMTGGDRMIHHQYADVYASHLDRFLEEEDLVIVECGILKGTGLAIWSKLFPNALLIGLDIDLNHTIDNLDVLRARGAFEIRGPVLLEFDQFKPNTKNLLNALNSRKVKIVIDDGFHSNETIINTFEALREHLAEGFVYFIEDNSEVYKKLKEIYDDLTIHSYGELTVIES